MGIDCYNQSVVMNKVMMANGNNVGADDDDVHHQGQWLRGMRHGYGVRTR